MSVEKLVPVTVQVLVDVEVTVPAPVVVDVVVVVAVQVPPALPSWPVPGKPVVGEAGSVPLMPPGARLVVETMPVACGLSSDRPAQKPSAILSTKRSCGLRVQLKPDTYCASMVTGASSSRGSCPSSPASRDSSSGHP